MNKAPLIAAGIDYDAGVRRFAGNAALYEKALMKFPAEGTFPRIRADHASGDTEQLLHDVHEFKGMCGNISLMRLFESAQQLIALLRADEFTQEALNAAYAELEIHYREAVEAIHLATGV